MLRISKKADYAVFLLGAIARQGAYPGGELQDGVVSAHEIARQAGLNKSVVANLLKQFARSGMLESVRGLRGGYRLLRNPADISLEDILEVVEGRFELVDCIAAGSRTGSRTGSGTGSGTGSAGKASALAQAPSMHKEDPLDCALIGFCPSKRPMRVVHERIAQMFRDIRLDELCSLPTATGKTR